MSAPARGLAALASALVVASVTPLHAQDHAPMEVLLLSPASGSTMFDNPFQLKGRVEGAIERGMQLRSATEVGFVRVSEHRFRFPVYLWADAQGQVVETSLFDADARPDAAPLLTLDYGLEALDPELLDGELLALDQRVAANPSAAWPGCVELARRLLRAGHPIFASMVLQRLALLGDRVQPSPALRVEALMTELEVAVVLGHYGETEPLLTTLSNLELEADRKVLAREIGEKLFILSDMALIGGSPLHVASDLLDAGNAYFLEAGLLPRRLLKGY